LISIWQEFVEQGLEFNPEKAWQVIDGTGEQRRPNYENTS
jgi:hypothetical protein